MGRRLFKVLADVLEIDLTVPTLKSSFWFKLVKPRRFRAEGENTTMYNERKHLVWGGCLKLTFDVNAGTSHERHGNPPLR